MSKIVNQLRRSRKPMIQAWIRTWDRHQDDESPGYKREILKNLIQVVRKKGTPAQKKMVERA